MDQKRRAVLIGGALFLESAEQVQAKSQPHYTHSWSQDPNRPKLNKSMRKLLDSIALLLVPKPGSPFVTACSLDQPRADHCAQPANRRTLKSPALDDTAPATDAIQDQVTLRIARNGQFKERENRELRRFAMDIINPEMTNRSDCEQRLTKKILNHCRGKIEDCIVGYDPTNPRIRAFRSFVEVLRGIRRRLDSSGRGNGTLDNLLEDLDNFTKQTDKVKESFTWQQASTITSAAAEIRRNKAYMAMLSKYFPRKVVDMAKKFLGRLAAYSAALGTLRDICWRFDGSKPPFTKIAVSVLPHRHEEFQRPTQEELEELVRFVTGASSIGDGFCKRYDDLPEDIDLKEHCEILLARFYLENLDVAPVLPYLGVSKLCCFLCFEFLKRLQKVDGAPDGFCVRGGHGKVYGKWLPPDGDMATRAARKQVLQGLQNVATDIGVRVQGWLNGERINLPASSDSPEWSSDESAEDSFDGNLD